MSGAPCDLGGADEGAWRAVYEERGHSGVAEDIEVLADHVGDVRRVTRDGDLAHPLQNGRTRRRILEGCSVTIVILSAQAANDARGENDFDEKVFLQDRLLS